MFVPLKSRPQEMGLSPIATILSNLKAIANQVRTNVVFCQDMKKQLQGCGYDWCNMFVGDDDEQVMKVLSVAVNEAIQKKVYLGNQNSSVVNQELHQLLLDNDDNKSLDQFFFLNVAPPPSQDVMLFMPWTGMLQTARSPLDMTEYLRGSAPQWLVKKMIQHQFEIRWNTDTPTGEPAGYSFYQFCDKAEKTTKPKDFKYFKYKPRLAHVKATLYKESRRNVYYLQSITKEKLCPKVYIRTVQGWQADNKGQFNGVNIENDLSWINPSIRKFITENADEQKVESLENSLDKPTLYWAVLNDKDFVPGEKLKLKSIGRTQVYVGKANNGIRGRWMKDSDNHCEMMKKCLDNVCAMTTYDPLRLEGIQLVDARLALAKVRRDYAGLGLELADVGVFFENTALFVIKTFGDDVEKAEIAQQKAQIRFSEASFSYAQTHLQTLGCFDITPLREALLEDTPSTLDQLKAEAEERQEELDEAIAAVNDLNDSKTSKAEAEALLTQAEKLHRKGKRVHEPRKNIIPYKDWRMTWKPTNMACGMNFN